MRTLPSFSAVRPNERDVAAAELLRGRAKAIRLRLDLARRFQDFVAGELESAARAILAGEHVRQTPDVAIESQGD